MIWRIISNLLISISNHITDPPALVLKEVSQRSEQYAVAGLLLLGNFLSNGDENINRQKADTVLIIVGEVLEKGYHFFDNNFRLHLLDELGEVVGRLSADHRSLIVYKVSKVLSEALLQSLGSFSVWCRVQTCRGDLRGEPIRLGEVQNQGDEMLFHLAFRQLLADFVERFDGLNRNKEKPEISDKIMDPIQRVYHPPFPEPEVPRSPPGSPAGREARVRAPVLRRIL